MSGGDWPRLGAVAHDDTARLIPGRHADESDVPYRLFLADIRAQDFALLDDGHPSSVACLTPNSYVEGQALGRRLRRESRGGVRYPSVRHPGGTCLAVLQAPMVSNVRRAATYRLSFRNSSLVGVETSPLG